MSELPAGQPRPVPQIPKRRRWLWRSVAGLTLAALLGAVGVAVAVGWGLSHPIRKPVTTTPAAYGLTFESVEFRSREDNLLLKGWFIPAAGGASPRTVVLAHGYAANRLEMGPDALKVAKFLTEGGYNALLFDFRGSGESEGDEVTVGWKEVRDLAGAVDYARERGAKRVGLIGWSMGGATALMTGARLPEVDAVISDSAYSDFGPFILENAKNWTKLPDMPFTYIIYWTIPRMLGADLSQVSPIRDMQALARKPVLLVHGSLDTAIAVNHAHQLFTAYEANGGKQGELLVFPGAGHVKAFKIDPQRYQQAALRFFGEHLK